MIFRLLVFLIFTTFLACRPDASQNSTSQDNTSNSKEELSPSSNSGSSEISYSSDISAPSIPTKSADGMDESNTSPTANTTTPQKNTNQQTISVPTTSSQKNMTSTANEDVPIKYGGKNTSTTKYSIDPEEPDPIKVANLPLPNPCDVLSESFVKTALKLSYEPEEKPGSTGGKGYEKSCFWRYEDPTKPNAGIMLQIMINPYSNDIDDFPSILINSKIKDGEMSPYSKEGIKFKPWDDVTPGGCYSYEAGKYHWKVGKKYVFMLAFNSTMNEATQKQIAAQIGKEVLSNYKF